MANDHGWMVTIEKKNELSPIKIGLQDPSGGPFEIFEQNGMLRHAF